MSKTRVIVTEKKDVILSQKEFDADMVAIRKTLEVLEKRQVEFATERIKIADIAKKASTTKRIGAIRKKQRQKSVLSRIVTVKG